LALQPLCGPRTARCLCRPLRGARQPPGTDCAACPVRAGSPAEQSPSQGQQLSPPSFITQQMRHSRASAAEVQGSGAADGAAAPAAAGALGDRRSLPGTGAPSLTSSLTSFTSVPASSLGSPWRPPAPPAAAAAGPPPLSADTSTSSWLAAAAAAAAPGTQALRQLQAQAQQEGAQQPPGLGLPEAFSTAAALLQDLESVDLSSLSSPALSRGTAPSPLPTSRPQRPDAAQLLQEQGLPAPLATPSPGGCLGDQGCAAGFSG
jgi:hypothetical protein